MNFQSEAMVAFSWVLIVIGVIVLLSTIFYVVKIVKLNSKVKEVNYPIIGFLITLMGVMFLLVISSLAVKDQKSSTILLIIGFALTFISFAIMLILFNKISLVITNDEIYIFSDKIRIDQIEAIILDNDRKRLFIAFKNQRKQLKSTSFIIGSKFEKIILENVESMGKEVKEISFETWKKTAQRVDKI
ncbi:hypothetical protein STIUS_v1c04800 [Spiroplasma sp. TIUS-1]|uniref:hypothetical protein n=1 Tax=Spiroplasma sp. TIUS-1 TaxID=216963 RepID=UPI0013985445|nr:hypothetical protein [Spiroplasma sp. TIUS-1]QHX36034.1 hypothetical protein STIUS_v1c04800 [Spiroplasma sp. TIUS-1]